MAPTITQESDKNFKADWNCSSLHERLISPGSKEEKINAYAEWADTYDQDVMENDYRAPRSASELVLGIIESDESMKSLSKFSLLDAGCGTGLTCETLVKMAAEKNIHFDLVGLDYSPDMVELAREKGVYNDLQMADLNETMPVDGREFDFCIATGVFLEGHCGPPALVNILAGVKPGRYAVISVRNESFKPKEVEYLKVIADAGCSLLSNSVKPYLGPVVANYLTIRKN